MIPVTNAAGVTSNPGLRAALPGFATRTCTRFPRRSTPHAPRTSDSARSSIGMSTPRSRFQSIVDSGMAT